VSKKRCGARLFVVGVLVVAGLLALQIPGLADGPIGYNFPVGALNEHQVYPSVAYNSEWQEYLVVWHNEWPGNKDIYGQRVRKGGTLIGPWFAVSAGPWDRYYPDVAYNSQQDEYLVVWEHKEGATYSIRAQRLSPTGQHYGGEIIVASPPSMHDQFKRPAVEYAFTEDKYLVVWEWRWEFGVNIECQKLSSTGAVEGSSQTIAGAGVVGVHEDPDVAYNRCRNEYLVVWEQWVPSPGKHDIYARRVRGDGTPMHPESILVCYSISDMLDPAVAAIPTAGTEGQYLIVWKDLLYGPGYIEGTRLGGGGDPIWPVFFIQSNLTEERSNPAVAGNESAQQYLVVWCQAYPPPYAFWGVGARTVPVEGDLLGEARGLGGLLVDRLAVASGPLGDFLVAFDDEVFSTGRDTYGHLWGTRVYLPLTMRRFR